MCQPESERSFLQRRKFGRVLSIFVLVFATVAVSISQLRQDSVEIQQEEEKQDHAQAKIVQNITRVHHRSPRNITLDFNNRTSNTSLVLAHQNISLCTQIRNEPPEDVIEWLTYYRLVYRVNGICIIDDGSTIDYIDIFAAFGVRTVPSRNDRNQNFDLCRGCLGINETENYNRIYISDVDEYLYVRREDRFSEYVSLFNQVSVHTLTFANADESRNRNQSLILENKRRAPHPCRQESFNHSLPCREGCWYDSVKSISLDRNVTHYLTHTSKVRGISIPIHCDVATVHHYFIRSQNEFLDKFAWDENSKWAVHSRYEHVLENLDYYTSIRDDRLKRYILRTFPDYGNVLQEYKNALLGNNTIKRR